MLLCYSLNLLVRRACRFSNFRNYTTVLKSFTAPYEDTPDEWRAVAEEIQGFPELVQAEKLTSEKRELENIVPCFNRAFDVFSNMPNKAYEILVREKLAAVFSFYGRIEQEYKERNKIRNMLYALNDKRLTGIVGRAENSSEICSLRLRQDDTEVVPDPLQKQPLTEKDSSPCIQKLFTLLRVHNFLKQLKISGGKEFQALGWKELVESARNWEICEDYGDSVGYLLLLASNFGLRCCKLEDDLIDFVSAAVVRYDSDEAPPFADNIFNREFARCLSLSYLGDLYIRQKRLDEAESTLTRALQIAKQLVC